MRITFLAFWPLDKTICLANTKHWHVATISTVKHGEGSIICEGAGPGRLVKVEGKNNAEYCHQILEESLTQDYDLGDFFSSETPSISKGYTGIQNNKVNVLQTPCQRPDLIPI